MQLRFIQCWEEHRLPSGNHVTILYWGITSSSALLESFDEVDAAINRKEVKI